MTSEAPLGGLYVSHLNFEFACITNSGGSPCRCQNFTLHFAFSFVAVVISWFWSCHSSSFQFLHVAVSEPCLLSEFYPNRASLLLKLSKCQSLSLTTVLSRTTPIWTIIALYSGLFTICFLFVCLFSFAFFS